MNTDKEFKKGADAYKEGKKESQNPYNAYHAFEKFLAWRQGFRIEKNSHEPAKLANKS